MAAPITASELIEVIRKSGIVEPAVLEAYVAEHPELPPEPSAASEKMVSDGFLTKFQAGQLLTGRYKGLLLGPYKLLERLGAGGMGVVFLAEHTTLRRRVAVKILPPDKSRDTESVERFRREARAVAALDHPNIVRAHDICTSGNFHFLVMEFVEGQSLDGYLETHGALPLAEAAAYISQAAAGLQHAFEQGLVHRDIKPGNLLLDRRGTIKILDMGLARFFQDTKDALTQNFADGAILGTADYVSPEQALNSHEADTRSDIYSLGVTFYALLNGQPPFASNTLTQKLLAHQLRDAKPLHTIRPEIPPEVSDLVDKMMAKRPEDRFQTPAEVVEALRPWVPGGGSASVSSSAGITSESSSPKRAKGPRPVRDGAATQVMSARSKAMVETVMDQDSKPIAVPASVRKRRNLTVLLAEVGVIVGVVGGVGAWLYIRGLGEPPPNPLHGTGSNVAVGKPVPDKTPPNKPVVKNTVKPVAAPTVGELPRPLKDPQNLERVMLSPDGKQVLGVSRKDGTCRLWQLDNWKPVKSFDGKMAPLASGAFSADGKRIVTAGHDGRVRIWDVASGKERQCIEAHKGKAWGAVFAPDDQTILSGGEDKVAKLWNADTGMPIRTLEGHTQSINAVAFLPDGRTAVTAAGDKSVRFWNVQTGEEMASYSRFGDTVNTLAVLPGGQHVVAGGGDGVLRLLDASNGEEVRGFLYPQPQAVHMAALTPDGRYLATGGAEKAIRVFEMATGKFLHAFQGHEGPVQGLAFTPDGRRLLSCGVDGSLRLWGLPDLAALSSSEKLILNVEFANMAVFLNRKQGTNVQGFKGQERLPPPAAVTAWDPSSTYEVGGQRVGNDMALLLRNYEGKPTVVLQACPQRVPVRGGVHYAIRVEYQTQGESQPRSTVLLKISDTKGVFREYLLPPAERRWQLVQLLFDPSENGRIAVEMHYSGKGHDTTLFVKRLEVAEIQ